MARWHVSCICKSERFLETKRIALHQDDLYDDNGDNDNGDNNDNNNDLSNYLIIWAVGGHCMYRHMASLVGNELIWLRKSGQSSFKQNVLFRKEKSRTNVLRI